jgi:16S rRNA (guanine527-N7)-methyltransferase
MSAVRDKPRDAPAVPADVRRVVAASVDREADVEVFRRMLAVANARTNLVGHSTLGDFWRRHYLDSAQLLVFAPDALIWADLGSGAGLPGVILGILMKDRPGSRVHLVESRTKRCRFLGEVVAALDLPAEVHQARAETLRLKVDIVTARACAPLGRLLGIAKPYMDRGARALFLKGQDVESEIAAARSRWRFEARTDVSLSDPRGRVVTIAEVAHADARG